MFSHRTLLPSTFGEGHTTYTIHNTKSDILISHPNIYNTSTRLIVSHDPSANCCYNSQLACVDDLLPAWSFGG